MSNELDKLLEERASDKKVFEDTFEDILGKTDEEIEESLKKDKEKEALGEAGDATKDPKKDDSDSDYSFEKEQKPADDPAPATPAVPDTATAGADWQKKAHALEDELTRERQRTASWDGRIKAANEKTKKLEEQVATLLADKQAKVETKKSEQDMSDKDKMELFKENFPELADFADIMQRKMDVFNAAKPAKVDPEPVEPVVPVPDKQPTDASASTEPSPHYLAITKVHPDIDELVSSGKLLSWINQQEDFIRPHLSKVYNGGSADEVISVVTEFKNKTGWKSQVGNINPKQDKLNSMLESEGESPGPKAEAPDKNDFAATAKSIGL